jgi:hypothetical protein
VPTEFSFHTALSRINDNYKSLIFLRLMSHSKQQRDNEDARSRHAREAHGAPQPRERERGERPLPPVTAEDQESVIGPEPVVREAGEKFLRRYGSGCWIGLSRITPGRGGGERLSRRRFRGGCERFPGACAEAQG